MENIKKFGKLYATLVVGLILLGLIIPAFKVLFIVIILAFKVGFIVLLFWAAFKVGSKIIK